MTCAISGLKREMLERYAEDFRKEIAVMEQLQHTNIVKFYGVCKGGMTKCIKQKLRDCF